MFPESIAVSLAHYHDSIKADSSPVRESGHGGAIDNAMICSPRDFHQVNGYHLK